jgi:hypothetical protein
LNPAERYATDVCVRALKSAYLRLSESPSRGGINSGHCLRALIAHTLWKISDDHGWLHNLYACLDNALVVEKATTSLFGGLPGIGWVVSTLGETSGYPEATSTVQDIARILHALLQHQLPLHDLINGTTGIAVFARAAGPAGRELMDLCWKRWLHALGHEVDATHWTLDEHREFDLGVAHGVPGGLAVFAAAIVEGKLSSKAKPLLTLGAQWLYDRKWAASPTRFSYTTHSRAPTRSAWCYGSLGNAFVFAWLNRAGCCPAEWVENCIKGAIEDRKSAHHGLVDSCLCHGHAGWAFLGKRLAEMTQNVSLRRELSLLVSRDEAAAIAALDQAASGRLPHWYEDELTDSFDTLLEGAPGSALAILALRRADVRPFQQLLLLDA